MSVNVNFTYKTPKDASFVTLRNQNRMLYANYIIQQNNVDDGCQIRVGLQNGRAADADIVPKLLEGARETTVEERDRILASESCPIAVSPSQPTPAPAPVLIPDPVASYLPTNGTTSSWEDTVGTLDATMTGSPTYSSSLGYTFDGSTQYGRIASGDGINNFNNTDTYSVEVWFNPSSGQPSATLATVLEKWNSTNQSRYPYVFRYAEQFTNIGIAVYDGTNNPTLLISNINTNTWVQVVGVFDFTSDILTGYKNGSSAGTLSLASVGNVSNTSLLAIAHRVGISPTFAAQHMYKGSIGLIRIYNTALSAAQVSQLFSNTRSTFGI